MLLAGRSVAVGRGPYRGYSMSRFLILLGIVLVVLGLALPWLQKIGLGRLPGDIVVERNGFRFYFPLTTSILVSLLLSALLWLFRR